MKSVWMTLLGILIEASLLICGVEAHSSPQETSDIQTSLHSKKLPDPALRAALALDYGRQIAYLAYKTTPEKQAEFIALHPDMQELYDHHTSIQGRTGLNNDVKSLCGFVSQKMDRPHEIIVSIRGTKFKSRADWLLNSKIKQASLERPGAETSSKAHNTAFVMEMEEDQEYDRATPTTDPTQFAKQMSPQFKSYAQSLLNSTDPSSKASMGFKRYADSMVEDIILDIKQRILKGCEKTPKTCYELVQKTKISLYGHSLGGAAAQLLAVPLKKALARMFVEYSQISSSSPLEESDIANIEASLKGHIKLFTYESPKVFNATAARVFNTEIGDENHIRIVQRTDFSPCSAFASSVQASLNKSWTTFLQTSKTILQGEADIFTSNEENCSLDHTPAQGNFLTLTKDPFVDLPPGAYARTGTECIVWIRKSHTQDQKFAGKFLHTSVPVRLHNLDENCVRDVERLLRKKGPLPQTRG